MNRDEELKALRDKLRDREGIAGFKDNADAIKRRIAEREGQG